MLLHKKGIAIAIGILLTVTVWAVSANSLMDQRSVLTGKVVAQELVSAGTPVKEGRVLVRVTSITGTAPAVRANVDGMVQEVLVKPGDTVRAGDVLVRIQPAAK